MISAEPGVSAGSLHLSRLRGRSDRIARCDPVGLLRGSHSTVSRRAFAGTSRMTLPKKSEERHRIDEASLARWMQDHVEGFQGPLKVLQFRGGQSNPTYKLETPGRAYVM